MSNQQDRRAFLRTASAAGAAWAAGDLLQVEAALAWAARRVETGATGKLEAFTRSEAEVVDAMASRILPAVDGRPGAREAGVLYFVDRALGTFSGAEEAIRRRRRHLNRRAALNEGERRALRR